VIGHSALKPSQTLILGRAAALLLLVVEIATAAVLPKIVTWDPSYGILAAQQHLEGVSPSILTLVEADPNDLSKPTVIEIPFWPPSYQAVPLWLRFGRFDWGTALKVTAVMVLVLAAAGWYATFKTVSGSEPVAWWLLAAMLASRYAWRTTTEYNGGDNLLWATAPWAFVLTVAAMRERKSGWWIAAIAGLFSGALLIVKYSGVFVTIGLGAACVILTIRHPRRWIRGTFWLFGAAVAVLVIRHAGFPQGLTAVNRPGLEQKSGADALLSLGVWTMGMTDLESFCRKVLSSTGASETSNQVSGIILTLLVVGSILLYLTTLQLPRGISAKIRFLNEFSDAAIIACCAAFADIFCVFTLIFIGRNVPTTGRLGRIAGLFLLPLLAIAWTQLRKGPSALGRWVGNGCLLIFLIVPMAYGVIGAVPAATSAWKARTSAAWCGGVLNPWLEADQQVFYKELLSRIDADTCTYTIYPQMVFPISERPFTLMEEQFLKRPDVLKRFTYRGLPAGGVALLVPKVLLGDGILELIKSSFLDIRTWEAVPIQSDPRWVLWISRSPVGPRTRISALRRPRAAQGPARNGPAALLD